MAKSPVYGTGRNYKRQKYPVHAAAGSVKMRGKKTKNMGCGCCTCVDMREKMLYKIHKKDMLGSSGEVSWL